MRIETLIGLACLALAVWEARKARSGDRRARLWFVFFLSGAVYCTVAVVTAKPHP